MNVIDGKVTAFDEKTGTATVSVKVDNLGEFLRQSPREARVLLVDRRAITAEQRKKIYALIGEIGEWVGEYPETLKRQLKLDFRLKRLERMCSDFSLADCPEALASEFIDYLVDFIVENGVPTKVPLLDLCEDIDRAIYSCLIHKRCIVCGLKAELHHIDFVGIGNDREQVDHLGRRCLPLCRNHHKELHTIGDKAFIDRYHLSDRVKIDEKIAKVYRLKCKQQS